MKSILILLLFLLSAFSVNGQQKAPPPVSEETLLRVEIENSKPLELKKSDLEKLPRREIKATEHDGKEAVFSGVELREILKLAGAKIGDKHLTGKELANYLLVEAADGYAAIFALPELDAEFTDKIVLLADTRDGKALSEKEGPLRIIVPGEKKQARWVRQVVALKIKKAQ